MWRPLRCLFVDSWRLRLQRCCFLSCTPVCVYKPLVHPLQVLISLVRLSVRLLTTQGDGGSLCLLLKGNAFAKRLQCSLKTHTHTEARTWWTQLAVMRRGQTSTLTQLARTSLYNRHCMYGIYMYHRQTHIHMTKQNIHMMFPRSVWGHRCHVQPKVKVQ